MNINLPRSKRIMCYGIETSKDWLVNYVKTHRDAYDIPICTSSVFNIQYAIDILQIQTGIQQLTTRLGYAIGDIPANEVPILAICTNLKSSFRNRPSQAQVDHLKQILGAGEPKWWLLDPDDFN